MRKLVVMSGAFVGLFFAVPAQEVAAQCGECNMDVIWNQHQVYGPWVPGITPVHSQWTSPTLCQTHWWCTAGDAAGATEVRELIALLVDGEDVPVEHLRAVMSMSDRLTVNEERRSIQLASCDGPEIVASVPLSSTAWRALAQ